MNNLTNCFKVASFFAAYSFLSMSSCFADDTEIFFTNNNTAAQTPNILFVVDTSGSMRSVPSGETDSRLAIVQDALIDILDTVSNVNVGLARYSQPGGPILFPVTYIDKPIEPEVVANIIQGDDDVEEYTPVTNGTMLLDGVWLNLDSNDTIGLRFPELSIPQGATITSAKLTFTSRSDNANPVTYDIYAEAADDAAAFSNSNNNVTNRPETASFVSWNVTDPWVTDDAYETPELINVVQEVVNRAGWCGGNAMSFKIYHTSGDERVAYTYEAASDLAPSLRVKFSSVLPGGASGCIKGSINKQLSNNDDDFEFTPGLSNGGSQLDFSSNSDVALRFREINIPQGATITSAKVSFRARRSDSSGSSITVSAIDADNAPSNNNSFKSAAKTSSLNWSPGAWNYQSWYDTLDISGPIQQVINRGGWVTGNDLGLYFKRNSGQRRGYSRNSSVSSSAKLTIEYRGVYASGVVTVREEMKNVVRGFTANGWTPIADTMAEAALYFKGDDVLYGRTRGNPSSSNFRVSHPDSYSGGLLYTPPGCTESNPNSSNCRYEEINGSPKYITPIIEECQSNHIVFLSDGEPTWMDEKTRALVSNWTGSSCSNSPGNGSNGRGAECSKMIASHLATQDQNPSLDDKQLVKTHTIGFDINIPFLAELAAQGNGGYYTPNTKASLIDAFQKIVGSILDVNATFVTSGLTVNQYNRLTHNDELYYSLFKPQTEPRWEGNLKRYRLNNGSIVDVNGDPAINVGNGEFSDTAKSWWSNSVDGNKVKDGGVSDNQSIGRTLYTNVNNAAAITATSNKVLNSNTSITTALLGADDASDRSDIIEWALGYDLSDPSRNTPHQVIGDPLHSRPTLITFNIGGNYKTLVFVGTNNGYLHVFDSNTGQEEWSFIPKELLSILKTVKENNSAQNHPYGMDGEITIYLEDTNNNSVVDVGEKAYLYIGMRRGGESYYGFDISSPSSPSLLFDDVSSSNLTFSKMGQSWSKPVVGKMNIGGQADRLVMIFGAGYDDVHDVENVPSSAASRGNTIYIADAKTGQALWNVNNAVQAAGVGSLSTMNAIPSNIKAFDINDDNLIDHIYATDMAGQVFRFDVNNTTQVITGGRIAHLQDTYTAEDNRKFYNAPDVALIRDPDSGRTYISIAIGSGYRAHPLDKITEEHMYVLQDRGVLNGNWDRDITLSDLVKLNGNFGDTNGDGMSDVAELINDPSNPKYGWYWEFQSIGEKVLAESLTFNNALLFTTYVPPSTSSNACDPASGSSRIYALSLTDGQPYFDANNDGSLTEADMYIGLPGAGIAPEPQVILTSGASGADATLVVGRVTGLNDLLPTPPKRMMPIKWRHITP